MIATRANDHCASLIVAALALASCVACGSRAKPAAVPAAPPPVAPGPRFAPNPPPSFTDPATGQMISGPGVAGPRAIYAPAAEYSEPARRDRVTGVVVMSVVVDATGHVETVSVSKPLREDLDANAVAAMKTWRFEPARNNGSAVPAKINVEMTFNMK